MGACSGRRADSGRPWGLFITLAKPTAPMKKEAASSGVLDTPFGKFARLQIVTIEDLFAGKKPAMPLEDPAPLGRPGRPEARTDPQRRRIRQMGYKRL